jgi:hypothetical protein
MRIQERLAEQEQKLDGEWIERMKFKTRQLLQERDDLTQDARQHAIDMQQSNTAWSESLTTVLTSTVTGEDIPSNFLRSVLPHPFSSMRNFSWKPLTPYVFAEVYTGLGEDGRLPEKDMWMADLLCWTIGTSLPNSIPVDALSQIVWLETDLLEKIRTLEKRDSWVLLAYRLLFKMVVSNDWPACCIAAVRLAVLARQYPMYNPNEWDDLVAGLLNQYIQLDIDPLGQACLAYLCLTTSNPRTKMAQKLPETLSQAAFDAKARIPELVSLLENDSPDIATECVNGSLSVVVVRCQLREVIFPRFAAGWSFSIQPLEGSSPAACITRLTWGSRPEQSIDLESQSRLWQHITNHHKTLLAQIKQEIRQRIDARVEAMRERVNQPLNLPSP